MSADQLPPPNANATFTLDEIEALKQFWMHLLEILELRPASAASDAGWISDVKNTISKHGHERYAQAVWDLMMMDDADYTAIKFVRARNLDTEKSIKMLIDCLTWRIKSEVDELMVKGETGLESDPKGIDPETFTRQISHGFTWMQGFNKYGGPVSYVVAKKLQAGEQSQMIMEDFLSWVMESIRVYTLEPGRKATVVVDLAGFGLSNMDWKFSMFYSKCLEAYYPECLHLLVFVNVPWVFQGVWKVLGPILGAPVRAKVLMCKSGDDLLPHVDNEWLLDQVGGDSKYQWSYFPPSPSFKLDQSRKIELTAQRKILIKHYIEATNRWVNDSSAPSYELRKFVAMMMRVQYLSSDPHMRAPMWYHRLGNIQPNGLIGFRRSNDDKTPGWEYVGHARSRETLLEKIAEMKAQFEKNQIAYPSLGFDL